MAIGIFVVVLSVAVLSHIAPFPFLFDAVSGKASVWRVPQSPGDRMIYLTFDDGPNPAVTPELLDLLRNERVPVTFFIIDEHVTELTAPIVRRMFEEGHGVGQHSNNRWLFLHSPNRLRSEFQASADHVQSLAGHRPCSMFRPHAGWRSIPMFRGLKQADYKLAGWSWLTWDWYWFRKRTGARVAAQVVSHAAPGKIIVIHDGDHREPQADRRYAIEATRQIVKALRGKGYEFAPMCEASNE